MKVKENLRKEDVKVQKVFNENGKQQRKVDSSMSDSNCASFTGTTGYGRAASALLNAILLASIELYFLFLVSSSINDGVEENALTSSSLHQPSPRRDSL